MQYNVPKSTRIALGIAVCLSLSALSIVAALCHSRVAHETDSPSVPEALSSAATTPTTTVADTVTREDTNTSLTYHPLNSSNSNRTNVSLHGRLVVSGLEAAILNGTLLLRNDVDHITYRACVTKGQWEVSLPLRAKLRPMRSAMSQIYIDFPFTTELAIDADTTNDVTLVGRIVPGTQVNVFDSDSRSELVYVTVVRARANHIKTLHDLQASTSDTDELHSLEPSPLFLTPQDIYASISWGAVYVGAPGYVWTYVEPRFLLERREISLYLDRAGSLAVGVVGLPADVPAVLRVRAFDVVDAVDSSREVPPATGDSHPEIPQEQRTAIHSVCPVIMEIPITSEFPIITIDVIRTGNLLACIELAGGLGFLNNVVCLGCAAAQVTWNQTCRIDIACQPPPASPPMVPLAGTLFVPAPWVFGRPGMSFEMIDAPTSSGVTSKWVAPDELEPINGRAHWYRWDAGDVCEGKFVIKIPEAGWATSVMVGPSGNKAVDIVLSDPATAVFSVMDADTGVPVDLGALYWTSNPSANGPARTMCQARRISASQYQATVPEGDVVFFAESDWYLCDASPIAVSRLQNVYNLPVRRTAALRIRIEPANKLIESVWVNIPRDPVDWRLVRLDGSPERHMRPGYHEIGVGLSRNTVELVAHRIWLAPGEVTELVVPAAELARHR